MYYDFIIEITLFFLIAKVIDMLTVLKNESWIY